MKIFWQTTSNGDEILQKRNSSFEEVNLPKGLFESLYKSLDCNAKLLPSSARKFQDWNVSLLARFPSEHPYEAKNPVDPLYE